VNITQLASVPCKSTKVPLEFALNGDESDVEVSNPVPGPTSVPCKINKVPLDKSDVGGFQSSAAVRGS
jgi:hypothetical protein